MQDLMVSGKKNTPVPSAPASPVAPTVEFDSTLNTFAATQPLPGDCNSDFKVDFTDFTILNQNFGRVTTAGAVEGDLNVDGRVDFSDFTILNQNFGRIAEVPTTPAVTFSSQSKTSFTQLRIDGTTADDSIVVTQSGNTLSIVANGQTTTYANAYGNLVIHGGAGADTITVDSSVTIATLLYGDDGADKLTNKTAAKATIVDIDSFQNVATGNGVNTSYWVNPGDTVNASSVEIASLAVNRVTNWYQPSIGAVPRDLAGQNLVDPTDGGATHRLTNNSFWGTGAVINDMNQGMIGDCYYLAPVASLANNMTQKFMHTGVDLGDGTYAVRYIRNGVTSYVRVDGDISNNWYTQVGTTGNMWALIYEKAYAFFRTGANTYNSLNSGNPKEPFNDLGLRNTTIAGNNTSTTIYNAITNALNTNNAVAACTQAVPAGSPVVEYHCYSVIGAFKDAAGTVMVTLRNPWGIDGTSVNDGNPNDGIITMSHATFAKNFAILTYTTV
jgi:hypothetical protein